MTTLRNASAIVVAVLFSTSFLALAAGGDDAIPSVPRTSPSDFLAPAGSGDTAPDSSGFIRRWLILEPMPATGVTQNTVQAAVHKEYFPGQFTVVPRDGDKVTVDGAELAWHALDAKFFNFSLYHFGIGLNKSTANCLMWGVTVVNCPEEMHNVRLAIGSNDASVWWVNGQEVIGIYGDRLDFMDDGVSKRLTLKKGANIIRCAIHNQGGMTDFCARILDEDGNPIKKFTINLDAAAH
jgi:hypothetical protein